MATQCINCKHWDFLYDDWDDSHHSTIECLIPIGTCNIPPSKLPHAYNHDVTGSIAACERASVEGMLKNCPMHEENS